MTLNGADYAAVFGQSGTFTAREAGKEQSALILRDVWLATHGPVRVAEGDRVVGIVDDEDILRVVVAEDAS